jgi:hypothetical protein
MSEAPQTIWRSIRRALIVVALVIGSMSLISLLSGRPGDFVAGLPGLAVGAGVGLVVVLVEVLGRKSARKQSDPDQER